MNMPTLRRSLLLLLASFLALTFSGLAAADPPSRVARLGYISGGASFLPAGQPDWVQAIVNRPLTTGDRLWAGTDSRAELQVGGAAVRLGADTGVTLLNLDDRIMQVQLSQGTLKVRIRRMLPEQTFEVDTPNLALTLRRPGDYRIDVDPNDDATMVRVLSGEADVYGEGRSYAVNPQQGYRFYGTDLSDYDLLAPRRDDDMDIWARERDRREENSTSARYVSPEVVGYEDLDSSGTWRADPNYGTVWMPTHVAAGWTPYRDGHWAWVDPWGWTWIDDAPWGYAVSHYGRWTHIRDAWGWVPGPPREQAVYAPALVAFVGGRNFQVSVSAGGAIAAAVGWFPLAPRDVYRPSYQVSRRYFDNVNHSNAVIAPTIVTNVYNTTIVNNTTNIVKVVYPNQQVRGAVVAVPEQAFLRSLPVARAALPLARQVAISAPVERVAAVAPVQQSVRGGAAVAATAPPIHEQAVVARTAPPPPPLPFAVQQKQLAARPGTPIDEAQRTRLKPGAQGALAHKVIVVTTAPAPTPAALPPATPPAARTPEARKAVAAKMEASKGEAGNAGAARAATAQAEASKAEAAKAEAAKAVTTKAEATRAEAGKADAARTEAARANAVKADAAKADAAKANAARAEAARAESAKADAARAATAQAEASKAEAARAEAARADAARADAAKAATTRAEAARAEAAKAGAARAATAQAEASRADAARADAAKAATIRAETARAESARAATAQAEASKAEAARAEAARANAVKADAARVEAAKAASTRAEAARVEAARAGAARAATAQAEAARAEAARANAAKADAARAEAAKAATARAEAARAEAPRAASTRPAAAAPTPGATPKNEPDAKKAQEERKKAEDEARRP